MHVGQVAVVHVRLFSNLPQPVAIAGAELLLGLLQPCGPQGDEGLAGGDEIRFQGIQRWEAG